ncbi:carboxymuconolactone decarboxylase family protein [Marinobacter sp. 1Y8]
MSPDNRYEAGLKKLTEIDGAAGQKVIDGLKDICPDLAKYIIEYPFGDIYRREGLDLRTRELATVSALTALGHCQPQLEVHINGALNVGCNPQEIIETILQMSVYAGFPAALNGMSVARKVFEGRGLLTGEPSRL